MNATYTPDEKLEEIIREMCKVAPPHKSLIRRMIVDYATDAYNAGVEEGKKANREHCDEKNCPECNLKAYNKGYKQGQRDALTGE